MSSEDHCELIDAITEKLYVTVVRKWYQHMWKDMLYSLPSRPAIILAPILITLALGIYYWDKKVSCNKQANIREELRQEAEKLGQISILKLADVTAFTWDKVRVFNHFEPVGKSPGCLFGWDWSESQRQEIIDAGLMTVLVFANEGRLVEYIELRSDQLDVKVDEKTLTPENALFSVIRDPDTDSRLTLLLSGSE